MLLSDSSNYERLIYEDVKGGFPRIRDRTDCSSHIGSFIYCLSGTLLGDQFAESGPTLRKVNTIGFDSTSRSLINSIFQGGTADIAK